MSFAVKTKNEIARLKFKRDCCIRAELTALIHMNGSLQITGGEFVLIINTENPAVARRIFLLLKKTFNYNTDILVRKKTRLKKNNIYMVRVSESEKVKEILSDLEIVTGGDNLNKFNKSIAEKIFHKKCCRRAYLRGAFLARGYINSPDSSYHLEINTEYEEQGEEIIKLLSHFNILAGMVSRKNSFVVYLKDGHKIVELLNIIGAHQALFQYENVRIIKEMRNKINRLVNCETANLNKTVNAALNQLESIRIVNRAIGIQNLPDSLKQIAELRIKYPEANLQEMGEMFTPPLSKSGVNHRLRKIGKIAQQLRKK
ncbi:MAG: DNA-binding protein WhiA [Firmicutes bacterium HGW-Firmicutes-13]|nr:MAG: DNA-binding protein WhiA [Firmicutes bacterium HGW-Firmicutes-13]